MGNPLKFYLGEESHYIVEDYDSRESSLFADQYRNALGIIDRYIDSQEGVNGDRQGNLRNNIVAFLGDRGTGKTSCMLSVLNMLSAHNEERGKKKRFASVDAIDPSFFDVNTNILFLVVGKMFSAFKEDVDSNDARMGRKDAEISELMAAFHDVQAYLSRMQKSPLDDNDTETNQLSNLLVTVDLKKGMEKLVETYLAYFHSDYLVIPVDDIDNNTEHAYVMAEQLRKYLVLPKVIILISFKLEQLANVVDLYFTKLYAPLVKQSRLSGDDIAEMTQKYLLKLFPLNQRVTLPNMGVMMDKELSVYGKRGDDKPLLSGSSVKYTMTSLIFRKTRYLFYHPNGETSPIVPTNLREYRTLLSLLCNMSNYREEKEEYNKLLFREYFFEDWVDKHLDESGKKIASKLIENNEASSFNKLVISSLSKLLSGIQEFRELIPEEEADSFDPRVSRRIGALANRGQYELPLITSESNAAYNVSIGDVFAVISEIRKRVVSEEEKMLIFFIESLYSIKLYHYYDEITELDWEGPCANEDIDATIKRIDILEGVSNYEKLIGGDFFNPNMLRLLPMENKTNKDRAYRVVNLKPLRDLLSKLNNGESVTDLEFQTIEFFALTLSRRLYGKERGGLYPAYRQLQEVYYRSDLGKAQKAIFDLGSFFSSISKMEFAYNRLQVGLFTLAVNRPNSLLNQLRLKTIQRYNPSEPFSEYNFLSWCCIRNAVILQEFGDSFSYIRTGRSQSSDQLRLLQDFFNEVACFQIRTYDKTLDDKDAYVIQFDYATVFSNFFAKTQEDETAKNLFYSVFGDVKIPAPEEIILNVNDILYRTMSEIRKDKLRERILGKTPDLAENTEFWNAFDEKITEAKISKEDATNVLNELKEQFGF